MWVNPISLFKNVEYASSFPLAREEEELARHINCYMGQGVKELLKKKFKSQFTYCADFMMLTSVDKLFILS